MTLVVTGVGLLIHIYSIGYMSHDKSYARFFAYLNLFTFAMLILVLGANLAVMFIGWEGVGLCSYLLIGFWFTKDSAANAGKKAFITNRVGDFGFLLGIGLLIGYPGNAGHGRHHGRGRSRAPEPGPGHGRGPAPFPRAPPANRPRSRSTPGSRTPWKARPRSPPSSTPRPWSRPASTWSPACTPCSRFSGTALTVVAVVGAFTAVYAATMGLVQNDIKRVLAYSTISQIGYMFVGLGVGAFSAGVFHLMTHAFFKSLLFLAAGSVIHALSGEQDMRKMGGLRRAHPADLPGLPGRGPGHRRRPGPVGLFLQGRDPDRGLRLRALCRLGPRPGRRGHDRVLHVPPDLPDLLRPGAASIPRRRTISTNRPGS